MPDRNRFVLDTSAILALRSGEAGADRVQFLLTQATARRCQVLVSFMTRMGLLYSIQRDEGEDAALETLRLLDSCHVHWISCENQILEKAAEIKSAGRISVADCWIGATAVVHSCTLVHKDPEFEPFTDISQELLR